MTLKKENNEHEIINENQDGIFTINENDKRNKLPYSVVAAYDGLFLDKNDMKHIYSELKNLKSNINRNNMDKIKSILIAKLNLELPTTRKYQLEHLTIPYTNDQISSVQKDDETKRNLIILQYYLDIICYGYSIHLTKWQCSSWFNVFKVTHEKFIEHVRHAKDSSNYRSECLEIFKNEIFYYCNPRTVTLYLKEDEKNKKTHENSDDINSCNDNLEEMLLSNRFIKPGIFDSILPPPPEENAKESNTELGSSSLNKSYVSNLSKNNNQSINCKNNSISYNEEVEKSSKNNSKISISINSLSQSKNTINNTDNINSSYNSIYTSSSYDNDDNDENELDKSLYIFEYNIPRTFNSLQIECLTRFFLKTYVQHINIIAYVFSKPQDNIYIKHKKTVVSPITFEELSHGIIAEEWPNWVQEQERILIKKKEEEEAAIEMEKKKKEEELLKEKEKLEEELAKQKLKETQENIINSLLTMLYQPPSKNISESPIIPLIKT